MAKDLTNQHIALSDPGTGGEAVDISSTDHTLTKTGLIYIGTSGDIKVDTHAGTALTFPNHPVGYLLMFVTKVYKTGTAASNMVAIW